MSKKRKLISLLSSKRNTSDLFKANQMWAAWKSKVTQTLNRQCPVHIISINPINKINNALSCNNIIIAKHLKIFRTIWRLIDLMAFIVGLSAFKEENINARQAFTASTIFFAYVSLFYTMFIVWPSIPSLLEVICIFGVLIPVS